MLGRNALQILVRRRVADAAEEDARLHLPVLEVVAEDLGLLGVRHFFGAKRLDLRAEPQLAGPGDAQIAHPLGGTSRRDEISSVAERQRVHRHRPPLAALAAAYGERSRATHAEADTREEHEEWIEDVLREEAGLLILRHLCVSFRVLHKAQTSCAVQRGCDKGCRRTGIYLRRLCPNLV